jgi:hypothetical protein
MEAIKRHEQDGRKVMLLAVGGGRSMLIRAIVERIPFEQERLAIRWNGVKSSARSRVPSVSVLRLLGVQSLGTLRMSSMSRRQVPSVSGSTPDRVLSSTFLVRRSSRSSRSRNGLLNGRNTRGLVGHHQSPSATSLRKWKGENIMGIRRLTIRERVLEATIMWLDDLLNKITQKQWAKHESFCPWGRWDIHGETEKACLLKPMHCEGSVRGLLVSSKG